MLKIDYFFDVSEPSAKVDKVEVLGIVFFEREVIKNELSGFYCEGLA